MAVFLVCSDASAFGWQHAASTDCGYGSAYGGYTTGYTYSSGYGGYGYTPSYGYGGYSGYGYGGYGYNPGGLGGPYSGLGLRPGLGFGGLGLRR